MRNASVSSMSRRMPSAAPSMPGARHGGTDGHSSGGFKASAIKAANVIANAGAFVMLVGIATAAVLSGPRS